MELRRKKRLPKNQEIVNFYRGMKTEISTIDLKACLKRVNLIANSKSNQISTHYCKIVVQDEGVTSFEAVNYNNCTEYYFERLMTHVTVPGVAVVDCTKLSKLIQKVKYESVVLEWIDYQLLITAGKLKIKIPALDSDSLPKMEWSESKRNFILPAKDWKQIYDRCFSSIGRDESRKNLTGLNILNDCSGTVTFIGADAFRIAEQKKQVKCINSENINLILPGTTFKKSSKIFDEDEITFSFNDNHVVMTSGQKTLQVNIIEAPYPDLNRLLQTDCDPHSVGTLELLDALEMTRELTNEDKSVIIKLSINGSLKIETQKTELGCGFEIPVDSVRESVIGLNLMFFYDAIRIFKKRGETIELYVKDKLSPVVIESQELVDFKIVIMPVAISW